MIEGFNSLIELLNFFDTEDKCLEHLKSLRGGKNATCPHCQHDKIYAFTDGKRWKCAKCRKQFTIKIGTIFENSKIPMQKWFAAMYLFASHKKGISSHQLARDLNVTQRTAWHLLHRLRHQFGHDDPTDGERLQGRIEADETFVGGKNKNRHWDKKVKNSQGRACVDKTPVFGVLREEISDTYERPHKVIPGQVVKEKIIHRQSIIKCRVIPSTTAQNMHPIVRELVEKGAIFISDEYQAYKGLDGDYDHRVVDHGRRLYVTPNGDTTNAMEGAWAGLKRSIIGIYHKVSRKHLQRYVNETVFRYNTRHMRDNERFNHALRIRGSRLRYRDLINTDG